MIFGIGVDLVELSRIKRMYQRNPRIAEKILTENELSKLSSLGDRRKIEYLGGRFASKEAFSKAVGTGIGKVGLRDIEILNDSQGKPYIASSPFDGRCFISISHTENYAISQIVLEK